MNERGRKRKAIIKEFGWSVILVPEDANGPSFAYSIGLQKTFKHPEIFVMGLGTDLMHQMINGIGERIKLGTRFSAGNRYADILSDYECLFAEVPVQYFPAYFGQAIDFYYKRHAFGLFPSYHFEMLQCLWPDKEGLFPADAASVGGLRSKQILTLEGHRPIQKNSHPETGHSHPFSKKEWPFEDAENTAALTTKRVMCDHLPVLLVTHDEDGSWQVLCGTTNNPEDALIECLGCAFARDRTIGELADLPFGWKARRKSKNSPWKREQG